MRAEDIRGRLVTDASRLQSRFPDRLRLPRRFDPDRLTSDLRAAERFGWTDHFVPQNYHGQWSAIPLRAPAGATHPFMMIYSDPAATHFVDTPLLARTPYFREVLGSFGCTLLAARLMRLSPGSTIKEHRDNDLAFEFGVARLHVPIVTNADVGFWLNGLRVVMAPGELWYLRLSDPHRVSNEGASDRVHLVIDAVADEWLEALLGDALAQRSTRRALRH
jgi:quercetin dioxygenase-like cupin family protein